MNANAAILKRRLRYPNFCTPVDQSLGLPLLDLEGVNLHLAILTAMREPIDEFDSFVPSLLLQQLSNLKSALEKETNEKKRERLIGLIFETRQKLWPLKN